VYSELASGAESGWDYSLRWLAGSPSTQGGLLSLNVRNIIGPDLNSILCEYLHLLKMMQFQDINQWDVIYRQKPSCLSRLVRFFQYNRGQPTQKCCCIPTSWCFGSSLGFTKSLFTPCHKFNDHKSLNKLTHSSRFMISFSIPIVVVVCSPPLRFILSGVVLSPKKSPITKHLHLELSHLSIW
jgi:Trehalase